MFRSLSYATIVVCLAGWGCSTPEASVEPSDEAMTSGQDLGAQPPAGEQPPPVACQKQWQGLSWPDDTPRVAGLAADAPDLSVDLPDALQGHRPPTPAEAAELATGFCESPYTPTDAQGLVRPAAPSALCCETNRGDGDFVIGCMMARSCSVVVASPEGPVEIASAAALAEAVAPVDSAAEAVGVAAMQFREIWVPTGADFGEKVAELVDAYGWVPVVDGPVAVQAERLGAGWRLRLPAYQTCGCQHHLFLVDYWVGDDGTACRAAGDPTPVAYGTRGICID